MNSDVSVQKNKKKTELKVQDLMQLPKSNKYFFCFSFLYIKYYTIFGLIKIKLMDYYNSSIILFKWRTLGQIFGFIRL